MAESEGRKMSMTDGDRISYEGVVLHHSTGPEFYNSTDLAVRQWYDDVGYARGYQSGALNSNHESIDYPGEQTYAMAQFAGRKYDADGNKYGYRIIPLMQDAWNQVAWQCGNWDLNCRTVGIENCGNYLNQYLNDKQLMCIADFFRPRDRADVLYWNHQEIFSTACPAHITEQRDKIVDMINNPAKWNELLWPSPAPVPTPVPNPAPAEPEWIRNKKDYSVVQRMYALSGARLIDITKGLPVPNKDPYPVGTPFDILRQTDAGGKKYYISQYSAGKNIWNGIEAPFLSLSAPVPSPPPTPVPTPTPTPVPTPTVDPVKVKKMVDGIKSAIKEYEGV